MSFSLSFFASFSGSVGGERRIKWSMVMEDNESCSSRVVESTATQPRQQRLKFEVYSDVLRCLKESNNPESNFPGFDDELWSHFNRLPTRYALDVNVDRAEDVLTHKRMLQLAKDPAKRPVFDIRLVQVHPHPDLTSADSSGPKDDDAQASSANCNRKLHPPPAFGSSPNLEALALESSRPHDQDEHSDTNASCSLSRIRPMHEVTFSTDDKPKLLSQLTALLAEVGLNIQEAHAFSTSDGYSLDVFVVDGWPNEETQELRSILEKEVLKIEKGPWPNIPSSPLREHDQTITLCKNASVKIPCDGTDVWEIDLRQLKFEKKIASGSYGDLYKGTYYSQEVAIKVLKPERINVDVQKDFAQEVYIMR